MIQTHDTLRARTRRLHTLASSLTLALALTACGGATRTGGGGASEPTARRGPTALELARTAARERPTDPIARRALLEHELLAPGGSADEAERVLASIPPAERDIRVAYLAGLIHAQHGRANDAVDAFVSVLTLSLRSDDPFATQLARSALAYLRDGELDADRFDERVGPAMQALFDGAPASQIRRSAFHWLYDRAYRHGDPARAATLARTMGCPVRARVAGPFGLAVLGGFDTTLPAEGSGPMQDRYDLGPGRGTTDTRTVEAVGCVIAIGGNSRATRGPGSRVVEAEIDAPEAGAYVLAIDSSANVRATLDGREVLVVDRRGVEQPSVVEADVTLTQGRHELELRITSREAEPRLAWMLGRGSRTTAARPESPLEGFLIVETRSLEGRSIAAREGLRHVFTEDGTSAMLILAARISSNDPFVASTQREDDERRLVRRAVERDPAALGPARRLASLEQNAADRLTMRRELRERFPTVLSVELDLHDELREASLVGEARESLARAQALRPSSCPVLAATYDDLQARDRVAEARALLPRLVACDARDESILASAAARRDWAAVEAELTRLAPLWSPRQLRASRLSLARARGDAATERRLQAELETEAGEARMTIVSADRRYAERDRHGALEVLDREAARAPDESRDLRRLMFALSGADVMQPHRRDGLAAIRAFEASGRRYDGHSAVLLFDYMVTRVLPSGGAIDLVHQIYRVQSQEGVERFGELTLSGRVLTVRVVAPDGSIREPDAIRDSTTMPPLHIGDYVEYEVVRERGPVWGDSYLSDGWVFQNFSAPFDHSEMTFVSPPDLELTFDVRGPVPPPTVTTENGLRVTRFLMTQVLPLTREPDSVDDPPIVPSLRAGVRVTWDRMLGAVADQLLDSDLADPAIERLLTDDIGAGASESPATRVQRIHRWVLENIEPSDGSFFEQAALMVAARAGNRARALRYLLNAAGVPATIAVSRDLAGARPGALPDSELYGQFLVGASIGGSRIWLQTGGRGLPHAFMSPTVASQDAIVLEAGLPHVAIPAEQGSGSQRRVEADVQVSPQGVALLSVRLSFTGFEAAGTRNAILEIPEGDRATLLAERLVPSMIPGGRADPRRLEIRGLDDWEAPLEILFVAESAALFARDGEAQRVRMVPLFATDLEGEFAALRSRTTTMLAGGVDREVVLHVRGPGVVRPPQDRSVRGPRTGAGAMVASSVTSDGVVTIRHRVVLPLGTTSAADYPALVQFCRAATEIERASITIGAQ